MENVWSSPEGFCESVQCTALPASEDVLIFYVAQLSRRLAHSSICTYMSVIRSMHVMKGLGDPCVGRLKLEQFLKGVRRLNSCPKDSRLITDYSICAEKDLGGSRPRPS